MSGKSAKITASKSQTTQQTANIQRESVETEEVTKQEQNPLAAKISSLGNTPNPNAHTAMINRAAASPQSSQQVILQLQRQYGNRYVNQVLQQSRQQQIPIQAKLTLGAVGDQYEQEADRVAKQVVNQIQTSQSASTTQTASVQREMMPEEEELQRKPIDTIQREGVLDEENELGMNAVIQRSPTADAGTITPDLETSIQQARGSGQPLADNIRQPMEQAFGADFSGVKIHTDAKSNQLNQSIQAKAFTTGQDVFFRQGEYNPGSSAGQELLAHELTHVVQQTEAVVNRNPLTPTLQQKPTFIQRKLVGRLANINQNYLNDSKFTNIYPELKLYKTRQEVLTKLKNDQMEINNDDNINKALAIYFPQGERKGEKQATTTEDVPIEKAIQLPMQDPISQQETQNAFPRNMKTRQNQVLSNQNNNNHNFLNINNNNLPDRNNNNNNNNSRREKREKKEDNSNNLISIESSDSSNDASVSTVINLYEQGLLLVTSIQPKDLDKMHKFNSRQEIENHVDKHTKRMVDIPNNPKGAMENAKVNWTLTSPRMPPHYFKMIQDKNERRPKTNDDPLGNRIATLVDATHSELMYMRGKEGRENLSDWNKDQSSSKHAGVKTDEPLYNFNDEVVKSRLEKIKKYQESQKVKDKDKDNPEINTFGFPPAAVVGFLVVRLDETTKKSLKKAKAAMSETEQKRNFPVFTWEATNNQMSSWRLVFLEMI